MRVINIFYLSTEMGDFVPDMRFTKFQTFSGKNANIDLNQYQRLGLASLA